MKIEYFTRGYHVILDNKDYTVGGDTIDEFKREFFRILEDEIDDAINDRLRQTDVNENYIDIDFDDDLK